MSWHSLIDSSRPLAWSVTGDVDYLVRLACHDLAGLNTVLADLRDRGGAAHTSTSLLLHPVPGLGGSLLDQLDIEGHHQ